MEYGHGPLELDFWYWDKAAGWALVPGYLKLQRLSVFGLSRYVFGVILRGK